MQNCDVSFATHATKQDDGIHNVMLHKSQDHVEDMIFTVGKTQLAILIW